MRRLSQKILRVLDGSPGAMGGYQRGQSLVELLLVTPLLIIMVAGIIEIGWYANHVLILLEVTRVGARQATLFTGEYGYQSWDNKASVHPIAYTLSNGFTPVQKNELGTYSGTTNARYIPYVAPPAGPTAPSDESKNYRDCGVLGDYRGFYNSVVCSMMNSLEPLTLKGRAPSSTEMLAKRVRVDYNYPQLDGREFENGRQAFTYKYNEMFLYPDDIVVSVFALQPINNATDIEKAALKNDPTLYSRTYDLTGPIPGSPNTYFPRGHQVVVAGRYPTNANECNVTFSQNVNVDTSVPATIPPTYVLPIEDRLAADESYMQRVLTLGAIDADYANRSWDLPHTEFGINYKGRDAMLIKPPIFFKTNEVNPAKNQAYFNFMQYTGTPETWMFRDPFEYYGTAYPSSLTERNNDAVTGRWFELDGLDKVPEYQRGFTWTGQHIVNQRLGTGADALQLFCLGSEWSDQRVQDMMNSPSFLKKDVVMPPGGDPNGAAATTWRANQANVDKYNEWQQRAKFLPSQGAVLVEMFWRHDILLNFPLMRPVIRLMEGAGGPYNIVISVWAVFPLPSAEPNLTYGFPPKP